MRLKMAKNGIIDFFYSDHINGFVCMSTAGPRVFSAYRLE